jgi:hypothetical protein
MNVLCSRLRIAVQGSAKLISPLIRRNGYAAQLHRLYGNLPAKRMIRNDGIDGCEGMGK